MKPIVGKEELIGRASDLLEGIEGALICQKTTCGRVYCLDDSFKEDLNLTHSFIADWSCIEDFNEDLELSPRKKRLLEIIGDIVYRWGEIKRDFVYYTKKSEEEVIQEYNNLHEFRCKLWYCWGDDVKFIPHVAYRRKVIKNGHDTKSKYLHAFEYNCSDGFNASTILINGEHFIAMREPRRRCMNEFFKVLIDEEVPLLVRLNQDEEYMRRHSGEYCKEYIRQAFGSWLIDPRIIGKEGIEIGRSIEYVHTDEWADKQAFEVAKLYDLVEEVRIRYEKTKSSGPIAVHCASGVGRTGTFIAAYVLKKMLEKIEPSEISIDEIVLKLSIQRPFMVGVLKQYLLLYEFFEYCLWRRNQNVMYV